MRPATAPPRIEPMAWLALVLAVPAMLGLLGLVVSTAGQVYNRLAPPDDSLKATLYSADADETFRTVAGLSALAATAAVGLGIQALRSRRRQPSSGNTQVAATAIISGLLFLVLLLVAVLFS